VQILAGDESVFMELRFILGTWYCMLISVLLYTNPIIQATDLQYHAHVSNPSMLFTCSRHFTSHHAVCCMFLNDLFCMFYAFIIQLSGWSTIQWWTL